MKRCWVWFQSLSRFSQIGVTVLVAHGGVILMLLVHHATAERLKPKKPMVIRTAWAAPQKSAPLAPLALKKVASGEKKNARIEPKKRAGSPKKSAEKKTEGMESEALLKIADGLAAIGESSKSPKTFIPDLPPSVEMQSTLPSSNNLGYSETVSAILQNCLALPEFGEVVAKVEIDPSGKVIECEILKTQSRKNAEFLKKRLQELAFPCFNEFGLKDAHVSYTITFQNVENR